MMMGGIEPPVNGGMNDHELVANRISEATRFFPKVGLSTNQTELLIQDMMKTLRFAVTCSAMRIAEGRSSRRTCKDGGLLGTWFRRPVARGPTRQTRGGM